MLLNISRQCTANGNIIKLVFYSMSKPASLDKLAPNIIALNLFLYIFTISADIDSNKSAA